MPLGRHRGPGIPPTLGSATLLAFWLWRSPYSTQASVACSYTGRFLPPMQGCVTDSKGVALQVGGQLPRLVPAAPGAGCWVLGHCGSVGRVQFGR